MRRVIFRVVMKSGARQPFLLEKNQLTQRPRKLVETGLAMPESSQVSNHAWPTHQAIMYQDGAQNDARTQRQKDGFRGCRSETVSSGKLKKISHAAAARTAATRAGVARFKTKFIGA